MRICVIDGHGGGLGSRLVRGLRTDLGQEHEVIGLATNQIAAEAMGRAGAERIGVGPDVIAETLETADVILTSLSMILPDSRTEQVDPHIVRTILQARGRKILLPINRFRLEVAGTESSKLEQLISKSVSRVCSLLDVAPIR